MDRCKIEYKEYPNTVQICNPFAHKYPPYSEDTKFHLGLNYKKQVYHCFKTGIAGKLGAIIKSILKVNNIHIEDLQLDDLEQLSDVKEESKPEVNKEEKIKLPDNCYQVELVNGSTTNNIFREYLISRGITHQQIAINKFYYCVSGYYAMRIIIPYYIKGQLVYWTARDITNTKPLKYLYPQNTVKTKFIYNYDNCSRGRVFVCEGQFNALVVNGVALGGKDLSLDQCKLIRELLPNKVTVALDQDISGRQATLKVCNLLSDYFENVEYLELPESTRLDFSDIGYEKAIEWIKNYTKKYNRDNALESKVKFGLE